MCAPPCPHPLHPTHFQIMHPLKFEGQRSKCSFYSNYEAKEMSDSNSARFSVDAGLASYRDYAQEAKKLVLEILQRSVLICEQGVGEGVMEWPTGENFTVELAREAIDSLVKVRNMRNGTVKLVERHSIVSISMFSMQSWRVGESWKYCIDYLGQEDDLHCFAVKYSEPTRRKPVPKATASVYFYLLEHSKVVTTSLDREEGVEVEEGE